MEHFRARVFGLIAGLLVSSVWATQYNVYVKINDANLQTSILKWNHLLDESGILKEYQFRPFLPQFPLHISLYLSTYEKRSLPKIKKRVRQIVQRQKPFCFYTGEPYLTAGHWLLLGLEQGKRNAKSLGSLQHLSDALVLSLASLRDKKAEIPSWAKANPSKENAFKRYGSPNVFFEFDPHLSLAGPPEANYSKQKTFQQIMSDFIAKHPVRHRCVRVDNIAIGEVNAQGQITREIIHFDL